MPLSSQPTRTATTESAYQVRARDLVLRCRKALNVPPHEPLDYRQFVGWLIVQKPTWSRPTWRQYKASVVFMLDQEARLRHNPVAQEAVEELRPVDVEHCLQRTRRTSGSKLKRFPLSDYRRLVDELHENPSPWSADLRLWLAAALLTGLRPKEWGQARYTARSGEDALVVENAKATNDRAHGPERTILLGGLTDEERVLIREHVERATEWAAAGQFPRFYQACAATLGRLARKLWKNRPQRVTLYSTRHQFSADAKASGLTREEIAALMGHAVDITATRHYGKKTAGSDLVRVRPDPAEVARVRTVLQARFQPRHPEPTPSVRPQPAPRTAT